MREQYCWMKERNSHATKVEAVHNSQNKLCDWLKWKLWHFFTYCGYRNKICCYWWILKPGKVKWNSNGKSVRKLSGLWGSWGLSGLWWLWGLRGMLGLWGLWGLSIKVVRVVMVVRVARVARVVRVARVMRAVRAVGVLRVFLKHVSGPES